MKQSREARENKKVNVQNDWSIEYMKIGRDKPRAELRGKSIVNYIEELRAVGY